MWTDWSCVLHGPDWSSRRGGLVGCFSMSPRRVVQVNPVYGWADTPTVVGGPTPVCANCAEVFYAKSCDRVARVSAGTCESEMAKQRQNTYHPVNVAPINEIPVFCGDLSIDLWDTIGGKCTKLFGFRAFLRGPAWGATASPSRRTTWRSRSQRRASHSTSSTSPPNPPPWPRVATELRARNACRLCKGFPHLLV